MFGTIRRKVKIASRRKNEVVYEQLGPHDTGLFRFYQLKQRTSEFFYQNLGRCNVEVHDTPHYVLASALNDGTDDERCKAEEFYTRYLQASWGSDASLDRIKTKIQSFRALFFMIKKDGIKKAPVFTYLTDGGPAHIVDGNHRVAIATALGISFRAEVWPLDLAFLKYSRMPEFYGSGNLDMPYQGLYVGDVECIPGRRNDLITRLKLIPRDAISGQEILDVASNVGVSSLIAHTYGARSCLGIELSQPMVDIATRFAMFSGSYPMVQYRNINLDKQTLLPSQSFDTAFMFSIYDHLKDPSVLLQLADRHVRKFVVFEGHPGGEAKNYSSFLHSGVFARVTELGRLHTSRFKIDHSRILWLCEKM